MIQLHPLVSLIKNEPGMPKFLILLLPCVKNLVVMKMNDLLRMIFQKIPDPLTLPGQ
jgi:hypothetical protein